MTKAPRPPVSRLTAKTLRKAHMCAQRYRRLGHPIPAGIALLDNDYQRWRRRVQRGAQPETLSAAPDA